MLTYYSSFEEALALPTTGRNTVYGTIIYSPSVENVAIDFGPATWPKRPWREMCHRILLVSTWTDCRWGFVGGGIDKNETAVEALEREFHEELGVSVHFNVEEDYCFSSFIPNPAQDGGRSSHLFVKKTTDAAYFQDILQSFEKNHQRQAYGNEVFAIMGMPLFLEAPDANNTEELSWNNNTFGLSRYLAGAFAQSLSGVDIVRQHFLLLLLHLKIINVEMLRKIVELSNKVNKKSGSHSIFDVNKFLSIPGVNLVIEKAFTKSFINQEV